MACKQCLFLLVLFIFASYSAFAASEAQEQALWTLWSLQTNTSTRHEAVVTACQQMQQAAPTNPLLPVSQGMAAWHSLRLGKTNEAIVLLSEMTAAAPTTPTSAASATATAGAEMARRWLTRLDREKVRSALALYYRTAIEYPINLQPLKKTIKDASLPLADRWDAPWQYQLAAFKIIQGTRGQRYVLQSKTLGESSDLAKALERPYADRILLQPVSLSITSSGAQNVAFQTTGVRPGKILLSEGGQAEGVTLTYIGSNILNLCDGDHWRVVLKPAK